MAQVIPLPWKDEDGDGFGGVLEIRAADIRAGARTKDLIEVVKRVIPQPSDTSSHRRVIYSIQLYGNDLPFSRSLEAILPTMKSTSPRLIVISHLASMLPCAGFSGISVIPQGQPFLINIKTLTGKTIPIKCDYNDTVWDVKNNVQFAEGFPPDQQRLVFAGRQLDDDVQMALYGMPDGGDVHLVLRLRGGSQLPQVFADVSDNALLTTQSFSSFAPEWRKCSNGLNIEGVCETRNCRAFGKMVIQPKSFHAFNLHIDKMQCPACGGDVKPVTCGFYDCSWKFEGVRTSDQCVISSPWKDAFGKKYHVFDADKSHGTVQWDSLLIIATRPHKKRENGSIVVTTTTNRNTARESSEDDELMCAMCWSSLRQSVCRSGATTRIQCGHLFHSKCVNEWVSWCEGNQSLATCPLCRTAVTTATHKT